MSTLPRLYLRRFHRGHLARRAGLAWIVLLGSFFLPAGTSTTQAQVEDQALVSEEERAWLDARGEIRVAFDGHFPPYSFLNEAGELEGFAVDVFDVLGERLGIEFERVPAEAWNDLYESAMAREVDVVATMVRRPDREPAFAFTRPYIFKSLVIVTRQGDDRIRQPENLAGKQLALVESYQSASRVAEQFPSATLRYYETTAEALNAVSVGEADATITFLGGGHYLMARHMMTNLRFAAVYDAETSNESIGVRRDWPTLALLLDRALQTITEAERLELGRRWLPERDVISSSERVALTSAEQRWIAEHPVIRVGVDPEFRPFEFIGDDGNYQGISADYLALLGPKLGLNFEVVPDLSWVEVMEGARQREIDLLPCVGRTDERELFLRYSEPYVEFQRVIVTRTEMPFMQGVEDLEGMRVAVQANSSHEGFLREHSTLDPIAYPTLAASVQAVSSGEVDAAVGNVASLAYWIRRTNLTNLKVAGAATEERLTLHLASRSDWPELAGIIQKGLASLTDEERDAISERWTVLHYEPAPDRQMVRRTLLITGAILFFLIAWIVYMRRQGARVARARDEAVNAQKRASIANTELEALRDELEDLVSVRTAELMDAEHRFQEAQKMEVLGTIVGGIAHDFNNILSGMLGSIYLVQADVDDASAEERLDQVSELGYRGADLISQLLAVARRRGGRKTYVDLGALMEETLPILRTSLPATIRFDHEEQPRGLHVFGNAALLQQVVLNLVNNARDAMLQSTKKPALRLGLSAVAGDGDDIPEGLEGDRFAVIEVADNGEGMSPEVAERIFDPFFTTKPVGHGTGLGLAMVFGAVQDHQGVVDVRTEPSVGTTFRVFLPLRDPPETGLESEDDDAELRRGGGERLLLVDDEPAVRESQAAVLESLGYVVQTANDGEEALRAIAEAKPPIQLVILDVLMPKLDGVAARREIRRRWPDLPVLFLSAFDPFGDLPDRLHPTEDVLLTKPATPEELSRTVRRLLRSARTD